MKSIFKPQTNRAILSRQVNLNKKGKTYDDVWQDNNAPRRLRVAAPQASRAEGHARTRRLDTNTDRIKTHSNRRQTVMAAGWISKSVSLEIDRLVKNCGLTRSKTIATLLEEAVNQRLHVQHAVLLEPLIRQAIAKEMQKDRARFAALLVRIAFDANTTRTLAANILGRQPGVTPERLDKIRDWSTRKAKESLTNRTPQIDTLIKAMNKWLEEGDEEHDQQEYKDKKEKGRAN